jgi:hypothetical protein
MVMLPVIEGAAVEKFESLVLLDIPEGTGRFEHKILEDMGHTVMVCHGPSHDAPCPALAEVGTCDLVETAHGVVFELDLDIEQHRRVLRRYQVIVAPEIPMRVVLQDGQAETYAELLEGVEVWNHQPSAAELDAFSARVEAAERTSP